MASPFDRLTATAAATHDSIMGSEFDFHPMKSPADINAPRRDVDTSRAVVTGIKCPFIDASARAAAGPFYQPGVKPERMAHATTRPALSLRLALLPYALAPKDQVVRQSDGQKFEVFEIIPSTPGFARIDLNRI